MSKLKEWQRRIGTPSTADMYSRYLTRFLKHYNVTPEQSLQWSVEEIEDRLRDFISYLQNRSHIEEQRDPLSGATLNLYWFAIKRWFEDNRIHIRTKLRGVIASRTYFDYFPEPDDLKLLIDSTPLKYKVGFALMAFSGLRPVDVLNLRVKNLLPSLNDKEEDVLTLKIRQQKTGGWYCTFLGPQGTMYLRRFFARRSADGERITNNSFVVAHKDGRPINDRSFRQEFMKVVNRTIGVHPDGDPLRRLRLYGLRKYFRRGISGLDESVAEYMMGHVKGIRGLSSTYSGLRDMDPTAIRQLKEQYIRALPRLETDLSRAKLEVIDSKVQVLERALGLSREDLQRLYAENDIVGGGKSLKSAWDAAIVQEDLEAGTVRDPLEHLDEDELDMLFIRALRKKLMGDE